MEKVYVNFSCFRNKSLFMAGPTAITITGFLFWYKIHKFFILSFTIGSTKLKMITLDNRDIESFRNAAKKLRKCNISLLGNLINFLIDFYLDLAD